MGVRVRPVPFEKWVRGILHGKIPRVDRTRLPRVISIIEMRGFAHTSMGVYI
jgi:hypothetical protein